ncbi:MarR family winged helix-turn-helix transcriptional regulator [Holophaga foetida]|uniref:MarR family winged helix-turn-helix transcriptional regulator n=1 Tax=Holophaga foetida TaxID=35839 RepID=UPI00024717D9|nr:MarR family transcriptional regulator [Holophaga foetida]
MNRPEDASGHGQEGLDPVSLDVMQEFRRINHLRLSMLARSMPKPGLPPTQGLCMNVIGEHEGITQRELGKHLHVSPATLSGILQRMERQGLIERWADEKDHRLMRLRLGREGEALHAQATEAHRRSIESTITPLCERDRRELMRLLRLVGDNFETAVAALK